MADTELDSGWQALCAARSGVLTVRQRAFLLRVSVDEFRRAKMFGNPAVAETPEEETTSPAPAGTHTVDYGTRVFADLVIREGGASLAFWIRRHPWSELTREIPECPAVRTDESFRRFGALLHLRRICGSRVAVLQALWSARLRLSALGTATATGVFDSCAVLGQHRQRWRFSKRTAKLNAIFNKSFKRVES